jgi:hypothetical protein
MPAILRVLPALQHDKLYASLQAGGWSRVESGTLAGQASAAASTWRHPVLDAWVSWVDDTEFSLHFYGLVYGPQAADAVPFLARDAWLITPANGIATLQEATTIEHLGTAARALGVLACGPFNPDVFSVLCAMLDSGNKALQTSALMAVALSSWPQFEAPLLALNASPTIDVAVRAEAMEVLEAQRASGWNREFREDGSANRP